jgi:hypothetical protein
VLLWRNADHITATFATLLEPSVRALVERHLRLPAQEGPSASERPTEGRLAAPSAG